MHGIVKRAVDIRITKAVYDLKDPISSYIRHMLYTIKSFIVKCHAGGVCKVTKMERGEGDDYQVVSIPKNRC